MRFMITNPKRVAVNTRDDEWGFGTLKHTTIDGKYVVHLDGECAEHTWDSDQVEFLEDEN